MEIKVFKDVSKKEKTSGGLTFGQWMLILSLFLFIVIDVLNSFYQILPPIVNRLILFPLIGLVAFNAMYRPHGLKFTTWIKLNYRFHTTIQTRIYQKEGKREYGPQDFKPNKAIKEAEERTIK